MGVCSAKEEEAEEIALNGHIDQQMTQDMQSDSQIIKLLLLGSGESGKSTIYKQLTLIHGPGFSVKDRSHYRDIIYQNAISNMKVLCIQVDNHDVGGSLPPELLPSKKYILAMDADAGVTSETATHIRTLWRNPVVQKTYANRAKFQLSDNCKYFCDKIDALVSKDYIPSEEDVLRARIRTLGIVSCQFTIEGTPFELYDVGGQRNERKKWIHCFDNVTAVLFVSAISEYDQNLYEDVKTNRVAESLNLFDQIVNNRFFADTAIILFLNKSDLFREKLPISPFTNCFPDYPGDIYDYDQTTRYFQAEFQSRNKSTHREVYMHITCATNTDNVRAVFADVKHIILSASVAHTMLV